MTGTTRRVFIGIGIVSILAGAIFLFLESRIWPWATYLVLSGISFILVSTGKKITRRLSFISLGAALVFLAIGLATTI